MKAEFEEKQFEQALNFELVSENRFLYTPGQCLENTLGFDAGLFSANPLFWNLFPQNRLFRDRFEDLFIHPSGIELQREMWKTLEQEIDNQHFFPQIRFNLFIQHKRPEYLNHHMSGEWGSWGQPYFRYLLTQHQQEALEALDNRIQGNGIVVYASPAFHTLRELWDAQNNNTLITNTNFVQANRLSYHSKFTYTQAGNYGIGFSEPEEIETFNFFDGIATLFDKETTLKNSKMLKELGSKIDHIMTENKFYSEVFHKMVESPESYENNNLQRTFKKISAFLFLTDTTMMSGIGTNLTP